MNIGKQVAGHLEQLTTEIEQAIPLFPDALWNRLPNDGNMLKVPCFLAHHTAWCMALEHLLRIPIERMPHNIFPDYGPDNLFTKQQVLDILADVRAFTQDTYAEMLNEAYLTEDDKGAAPLDRILYTIAHTRHHYGQMVQILRDNGLDIPDWYPIH